MNQPIKFKQNTSDSFFGHFLYEQILPQNHFLVIARKNINWQRFTDVCIKWYRRSDKGGRPPYNPSVLCRMLFLCYLYNISERQIESDCNLNLAFKYFLGLGADELPPDSTTLTKFKQRLLKGGREQAFEALLQEILLEAKEKGVAFGAMQIIDATHTAADVNTQKDKARQKDKDKGGKPKDPKPPRDPDASWGAKHQREVKDPVTGEVKKQTEYFYGYKAHESYNHQAGLVTAVTVTSGKAPDGRELPELEDKDSAAELLPKQRVYAADKGYDWGDNHEYLKQKKHHDAIRLQKTRIEKKNPNKAPWLKIEKTSEYQQGVKSRKQIERVFAGKKQHHGLRRCRYIGLQRYHIQATLTAIAFNLTVVVAHISGYTQRGYVWKGSFSAP